MPKSTSKWIPEGWLLYPETYYWALVSCFFSFLVPKSAKKSPQGVPEHPKYLPKASKEALQGVPEHPK